jgi:uncharacterized integral membrane protein
MAFLHRTATDEHRNGSRADPPRESVSPADSTNQVPLTRAGAAWVGVSAAAIAAVLVIIFLVQNTHPVQVTFLGMTTSTSLALMLLIAAVGGILLAVILGTARIVQLRRMIRRRVSR